MPNRRIAIILSTSLLFFLLLSAFIPQPAPQFANALPEGRTLDEGHNSGYIDWSGPVSYEDLLHRDALCVDCYENVTRIDMDGSVSGSFRSGVDVNYFEVMVARSGAGGFGTAILTACNSSTSVYLGSGGNTPGFNSVSLYVPPTCGSWSLSASGGVVYFRSVDANYSAPPQPPVISGSLTCVQPGNGGWCLGGQKLHLEASDLPGQPIIMYGKISGVDFSCPGGAVFCDIQITIEGTGTAEFTVYNPVTKLSDNDSLPYQLDASTPQIDFTLSGANGLNGWFVSAVGVSPSASDAVSGLALHQISVDGGAWQPANPLTLSDGMHTIVAQVYDVAGNLAEVTQNINVDTLTPELNISVNGAAGENGWYVSSAQVSALAQDNGSGIATLEVSVDGSGYTNYLSPITLSDGIHALQFRATDNAGNVTSTTQNVKVDTLTPNLSLTVNGKLGLNSWYVSAAQVSATATDAGSGVASFEAAVDGGAWSAFSGSLSFSDGQHTYQVRVKDKAGNVTQTPILSLKVDTIAPFIDMPATLSLGERLYYALQDDGSGLAIYRAVIEDDAEKYKKIVWLETMSGNKVESDILWDGKFKDGAKAKPGEYFITLKISDAAGNERMKATVVSVNLLNSLLPLPAFEPPTSAPKPVITPQAESAPSTFGGETGVPITPSAPSTSTIGGNRAEEKPVTTQTMSKSPVTSSFPVPASAILWGAASAAAVGYFVSEAQKRKEEEERRRREAAEAQQQALAQMFAYREPEPEPEEERPRKNKPLTPQERLQALWDRNGVAIYEANQQFKAKYGKEMDSETKKKAIKDATQNGVFQANKYASNLETTRQQESKKAAALAALAKQEQENKAAMQKAAAIEALARQELENKAAMQKAAEAAKQKAQEDFRRGEWESYVAAPKEEEKSWWQETLDTVKTSVSSTAKTMQTNFTNTVTSSRDWANRAASALPDVGKAILLAPVTITKTLKENYLFHVNNKMADTLSAINNTVVDLASKVGLTVGTPVPKGKNGYKNWISEQLGFDIMREPGTTIGKDELLDRVQKGLKSDWTERVDNFKNGLSDLKDGFASLFTKQAAKETAEEVAEEALEATAKEATESAAKSGFSEMFKAVTPGVFDAVVDTGFNVYDYTLGSKKDEPDKIQKILVGSGVDISGSLLTGALAAGAVAGGVAIAGYIVGAPVTVPLTAIVGITIGVGFLLDIALESTGVKEIIKVNVNNLIDSLQVDSTPSSAQPAMPIQTPSIEPQIYETPTPFTSSVQNSQSIEPQAAPAQAPSTPTPQTPEP